MKDSYSMTDVAGRKSSIRLIVYAVNFPLKALFNPKVYPGNTINER
jgi:hypothetical protein